MGRERTERGDKDRRQEREDVLWMMVDVGKQKYSISFLKIIYSDLRKSSGSYAKGKICVTRR
jgi:hypothetical protein